MIKNVKEVVQQIESRKRSFWIEQAWEKIIEISFMQYASNSIASINSIRMINQYLMQCTIAE